MNAAVLAAWLVSAVVGIAIHEATHYVVARAAGRRPWFSVDTRGPWYRWGRPVTVWELPDGFATGDRLAFVAPVALGVVLAPLVFDVGLVALPGWVTLTLTGIPGDVRPLYSDM